MKHYAIIIVFAIFLIAGFMLNSYLILNNPEKYVIEKHKYGTVNIDLLAVVGGASEQGLLMPMTISAQEGTGNLYLNIDDPTFIEDTQHSARIALGETERITSLDFSKIDVLLSIDTIPTLISGPSAGAAMTIGMCAAVLNRQLKSDVVITGTITKGGAVGPIGGILEKAKAAKAAGKKLLLVPKGEGTIKLPIQTCEEKGGGVKTCIVTYETKDVGTEAGIKVKEVEQIEEAFKEMIV